MKLTPILRQLSILDKNGNTIKLEPNWAQQDYIYRVEQQMAETGRIRAIILKARQLGMSTITEGLLFAFCMMLDNFNSYIVAHESEASLGLLAMTQRYWDTYPFKPLLSTKQESLRALSWDEIDSAMKTATAKNTGAGRSKTIRGLHASEVAFWEKPRETMLSLNQAIPSTGLSAVIIESTANGQGNYFQQMWDQAVAGDSDYMPLFYPWWKHYEYRASYIGIHIPAPFIYDEEERILHALGLDDDLLAWRRWAIRNKADNDLLKFQQEYPATPEEAFISTGSNVFQYKKLRGVYHPWTGKRGRLVMKPGSTLVEFLTDDQGPLVLFHEPATDREWGKYMIGADPTHTITGDYAVGQVINRRTLKQCAVFRKRLNPSEFAEQLYLLGKFYNDAIIAVEKEGPGYLTVGRLLGMNYPNVFQYEKVDSTPGKLTDTYGWSTNSQTKHLAIGYLVKVVSDGIHPSGVGLEIHDRQTFSEMKNYVTLEGGKYGNANGEENDDTVMSLAICVTAHFISPPPMAYGIAEQTGARPAAPVNESTEPDFDIPLAPEPEWESWEHQDAPV